MARLEPPYARATASAAWHDVLIYLEAARETIESAAWLAQAYDLQQDLLHHGLRGWLPRACWHRFFSYREGMAGFLLARVSVGLIIAFALLPRRIVTRTEGIRTQRLPITQG